MNIQQRKHLKFNVAISMIDAGFFGLAIGFGSFGTVIPLFFTKMTNSALLIGLIPAIHAVGWQVPQLFTAGWVSKMERYKPAVMAMTLHERLPFLGFAITAWVLYKYGASIALPLAFLFLVWQGMAAGLTANPWQSMIAKIIPQENHGTFFGTQASIANVLMSGSAIAAGYMLEKLGDPYNFSTVFFLTFVGMAISYGFIGLTREEKNEPVPQHLEQPHFWEVARGILQRDINFRWFLLFRILFQFATMGFSFYILYSVRNFDMNNVTAGYLTAALTITQTIANVGMGWLGDKFGHHAMLVTGTAAAVCSAIVAGMAPSIGWMYPVFIFAALANVAFWTIGMAMTVRFGKLQERPVYIGLANTLVAPASIGAPIIGGWLADAVGFNLVFSLSIGFGILTMILLLFLVKNPNPDALQTDNVTNGAL